MKEKKDLLIVTEQFYPSSSTDSILMTQLVEDLSNAGISVGVLTSKLLPKSKGKLKNVDSYKDVYIKRIKSFHLSGDTTIIKILNRLSLMLISFFYIREFKKYKISLCLTTPPSFPLLGIIGKKRYKTKSLFLLYDLYPDVAVKMNLIKENGLSYKITDKLYKIVYKNVDNIIAIGRCAKEYLIKNKNCDAKKIEIITNWQDEAKVGNTPYDKEFAKIYNLDKKFIITYSGNMGLFHDLETIVEFAKANQKDMPNMRVILCGKGDKKPQIVDLVKKYNLNNVLILDHLSLDEYNSLMSISDAFFVTLLPGVEGLSVPSKTYAYMLAGKPIISIMSPNAEISLEVKENNAGICVENGDVKGLTKHIRKIIEDKEYYEQLKKGSIAAGKKYERKVITKQYANFIKKRLDGNK